jgi:hypothetical protein
MGGIQARATAASPIAKTAGGWAGRLISCRQYNGVAAANDLRHEIAHVKASGRLPGEREMPGPYGAAPVTIRRAVATLAAQGVVVVTCGREAFAAPGNDRCGAGATGMRALIHERAARPRQPPHSPRTSNVAARRRCSQQRGVDAAARRQVRSGPRRVPW